jgi:hypothetical protein
MSVKFEELSQAVGSSFMVHTQHGLLELVLKEAMERPRRGLPAQFRTPVSLVFAGPEHLLLTQGNYLLDHPVLKQNQWVLGPISRHALEPLTPDAAQASEPASSLPPLYEVILG